MTVRLAEGAFAKKRRKKERKIPLKCLKCLLFKMGIWLQEERKIDGRAFKVPAYKRKICFDEEVLKSTFCFKNNQDLTISESSKE